MGGAPLGSSVSALFMQNAASSRSGKSLALVSVQGILGFPAVATKMRRIFGPCGGAARQGVLVAAGMSGPSEAETEFETWVAHRKAKKKGGKRRGGIEMRGKVEIRSRGMVSI